MYLIIGSGRAAFHFARYFSLKKIPFFTWNRRNSSLEDLKIKASKAERILLLISDSAIEPFFLEYLQYSQVQVIHMSGALEIQGMRSAHPLMTFGPLPYELETYEKISFAVSPGTQFSKLFPALSNASFEVPVEQRRIYHAWAVYSGNLATLLWKEALRGFENIGVPASAVESYLKQSLANSLHSPHQALTGPIARKDQKTITAHLDVLPEPARSIYHDFVKTYAPEVKL